MLAEFGVERSDIEAVLEALRALYDDRLPCVGPCRIVQDADRLDKLGTLGVGAFFTKATLRGRGLVDALEQHAEPGTDLRPGGAAIHVHAKQGRSSPRRRRRKRSLFSTIFCSDLESWGIASFERRTIILEEDFRTRDGASVQRMEVTIVMPRACPDCEAPLGLTHLRGRGVKCEKLTARFACARLRLRPRNLLLPAGFRLTRSLARRRRLLAPQTIFWQESSALI